MCGDSFACEAQEVSRRPRPGVNKRVCLSALYVGPATTSRLEVEGNGSTGRRKRDRDRTRQTKRIGRLVAAKWAQDVCNKMIVENDRQREAGSQTGQALDLTAQIAGTADRAMLQ